MNELNEMLNSMCEALLSVQTEDGGFRCDACGFEHGRADNALFPFITVYSRTGDKKWLDAARKLLDFRTLLENDDGSVSNDFESGWKGITAFSAIGLYKTLFYFGDILPKDLKDRIESLFMKSAGWVHENIRQGFKANVNYYCASAAVNAMYGKMYSDREYINASEELLNYCLSLFTCNGILRGEGQPHNFLTDKGCVPADLGYIVEEAIPCLTDTALTLNNEAALKTLADYSVKLTELMLPGGAWDNSFGSRNNKWTYYGSRTASGCIGAFLTLSVYRPVLREAAERNLKLMMKCSRNGVLYGGPQYESNNQPPCIHHTFSHALSIADGVMTGIDIGREKCSLPCDSLQSRVIYFGETDTYRIYCGRWIATVTGNDYSTYTWNRGAAHTSGGALSLLYHRNSGPVVCGSVFDYQRTETNNMQFPAGALPHRSLIPRIDITENGCVYSTALSFDSDISVKENGDGSVTLKVRTVPENIIHEKLPKGDYIDFEYVFTPNAVTIRADTEKLRKRAEIIVPVIGEVNVSVKAESVSKERIFFLTPGFSADEYRFFADESGKAEIKFTGGITE